MAEKEKEYEEELLMDGFDDESDEKDGKSLKKKRLTSINSMGDSMTNLSEMAMELEDYHCHDYESPIKLDLSKVSQY